MKNKRKLLVVAMASYLTLSAGSAYSLGLGSVDVHSALGQPFHASIPFTAPLAKTITPNDILVRLASRDEHQRQGLPYPRMPGIKMTVNRRESGEPYIQMKDTYPASEPIVNMVVEVSWPNGRIFKSLTLLLDPPEYIVPKVPKETIVNVKKSVRRESSALKIVKKNTGDSQNRSHVRDGKYIDVVSGDTLSEIAYQTYRQYGVDVITMMQALFEHNPQSFGRNMHQLKAGVVLEVPDKQTLLGYSQREIKVASDSGTSDASNAKTNTTVADKTLIAGESKVSSGSANADRPANTDITARSESAAQTTISDESVSSVQSLPKESEHAVIVAGDSGQISTEMLKLRLENQQLRDDLINISQELKASNARINELQTTNVELTARLNELTNALKEANLIADSDSAQNPSWFAWLAALLASVIAGIMSVLWWHSRRRESSSASKLADNDMSDFNLSLGNTEMTNELNVDEQVMYARHNQPEFDQTDVSVTEEVLTAEVQESQTEERERSLDETYVEVRDIDPNDACFQDTEIRRIIFFSDGNEDSKLLMLKILKETGKDNEFGEMVEKLLSQYPDRDSEMHQKVLQTVKENSALGLIEMPDTPVGVNADVHSNDQQETADKATATVPDPILTMDIAEDVIDGAGISSSDITYRESVTDDQDVADELTVQLDTSTLEADETGLDKDRSPDQAIEANAIMETVIDDESSLWSNSIDEDATELFIENELAMDEYTVDDEALHIDGLNKEELENEQDQELEDMPTETYDISELDVNDSEVHEFVPVLPDLELLDEIDDDDEYSKKSAIGD